MDWIKIKAKHLYGWPISEVGAIVRLQLLTAHLERMPTTDEIRAVVPQATCKAVAARLQRTRTTLAQVLHKVCDDCANIEDKRRASRIRQEKWRDDNKNKDTRRITKTKHNAAEKIREEKMREDKRREDERVGHTPAAHRSPAVFIKPYPEEIKAYCIERKNFVDPKRFYDHYEANGWKVGKNSMKDWKAAVRTWEAGDNSKNRQNLPPPQKLPPVKEEPGTPMPKEVRESLSKFKMKTLV